MTSHIACPSGLLPDRERRIEKLTAALNGSSTPAEKGRMAGELLEGLSALLECTAYDQGDFNCRLCRDVSTLRQRTASVISKAAALGR